jgi:hypothetical protein
MERDKKLNPARDYSGFDEIESPEFFTHDPLTLHLIRLCLASTNKGIQACFLYNVGYRLLISGDRTSSFKVVKILKNLDKNLSELLYSKLNKNLLNFIVD